MSSQQDIMEDPTMSARDKEYIMKYLTDLSCIIPPTHGVGGLYLSDFDSSKNLKLLKQYKIRTIISIGGELKRPKIKGIETFHIMCPDHHTTNLTHIFGYVNNIITKSIYNGRNVLIHCMMGVSRSASLCISYLMSQGKTYEDAYNTVKSVRPIINPNKGFKAQLQSMETYLRTQSLL